MAADWAEEGEGAKRPAEPAAGLPAEPAAGLPAGRLAESGAGRAPAQAVAAGDDQEYRAVARRLHRVLVDHTYGVARDAWAQASPDLRAAWESHQARYPEQDRAVPRVTDDGGWTAGTGRRLSPEQNAEASKACADLGDEGRRDILPALQRVEGADPERRLAGLQHMLKGEDRLKEKIADAIQTRPGLTARQALEIVPDPVRFTFTYGPQRYADGVLNDVDRLKAEGFELLKLKNLWSDEQYKGINSQWRRPQTGLRFEVQFHTPESLEAKELTHQAYERVRSSPSATEYKELTQFQRQVNAYLAIPERTDNIKDFPEKNRG